MRITLYQIASPLVSLVAIVYAWNLVLRRKKSVLEALLWTLFWGAITVFALYPPVVTSLARITGIQNQESAVIVTFLGVLFFMVFYLIVRLEELEQRHAKVVRAMALREADLDHDKNKALPVEANACPAPFPRGGQV